MRLVALPLALVAAFLCLDAAAAESNDTAILLRPARAFDGATLHEGWRVLVKGDRIVAAGADVTAPAGSREVDLANQTLLPGLIEGHSHLFLHPYNERSWDDQVLHESVALRTARAVTFARAPLFAGSRDRRSRFRGRGLETGDRRRNRARAAHAGGDRCLWTEGFRARRRNDPTEDVRVLRQIRFVVKGGAIVAN